MEPHGGVRHKHLVAAAVLAGAAGLALMALGWWIVDWRDDGWRGWWDAGRWTASALHLAGYLIFGKVGFKVALAVVCVGVGLVAGLRRRSRDASDGGDDEAQAAR